MLNERLKNLRTERNLKQKNVAEYLKISRATYAGYESGRREPSIKVVKSLSDYFEVSTDFILEKTDVRVIHKEKKIEDELIKMIKATFYGEQPKELTERDKQDLIEAIKFLVKIKRHE